MTPLLFLLVTELRLAHDTPPPVADTPGFSSR